MKTDKVLGILVIIAFVLLGGVYAQFVVQDQATSKNIRMLKDKVDGFDAIFKKIESQARSNTDSIKNFEDKAAASDSQSRDIASKLEGMAKDIQQLQDDVKDAIASKEVKVSVAPVVIPVSEPVQPVPVIEPEIAQTLPIDAEAGQSVEAEQVLQP
jgi:septal ring factor EnvC (AmiA/AmiB activator)